jgi:hypothetical protein
MDKAMKEIVHPPWIELIKLVDKDAIKKYVERLLGTDDLSIFTKKFGIDLNLYIEFWAELGGVSAPIGPVSSASKRLPIKPILSIKMSHSGRYYVERLQCADGFINERLNRAWIPIDVYEAMLGDTFFDEISKETERIMNEAVKKESSQNKLTVTQRK